MADLLPRVHSIDVKLKKTPTGIKGLDEILLGGLPEGRPTLVCGAAGSGKTLLASEFLVNGAREYNEPGVFISFEESLEELTVNLASLGINLNELIKQKKIFFDYIHVDRSEIEETGEYDLEGLFIRLAQAVETVGARRVVLDTIETIFAGFSNEGILRSELHRLFHWMRDHGLTAFITAERGDDSLTRHGLEEYLTDCVILLDHRVNGNIATRRLRVLKYRGSSHGNNEYPFLIDRSGIWLMPITSVGLNYPVSSEYISSGIPSLNEMMGGKGFFRGSSVLISGTAGTGKTTLAAHIVNAACQRGEKVLFFAFEESPEQIIRNMRSVGIDLKPYQQSGMLLFQAVRPTHYGPEMHLLNSMKICEEFQPQVVVLDPINSLNKLTVNLEVESMMLRLVDYFKTEGITAIFTSLTHGGESEERTDANVSSLMDSWLLLRNLEINGERNRGLNVLKSRGMAHTNQIREFLLTDDGVELIDVYAGPEGVLTGAARRSREAAEKILHLEDQQEIERKKRDLERKQKLLQARMDAVQIELEAEEEELKRLVAQEEQRKEINKTYRDVMRAARLGEKPDSE